MNLKIQNFIVSLSIAKVNEERKLVLDSLIQYVQKKKDSNHKINLNFICTHNSRRSQFAQVWAKVFADYYHIEIHSFSGGVEVTACNERTVDALRDTGFEISKKGDWNPVYHVRWSDDNKGLMLFSKLFDDNHNPRQNFVAVMTCSHADENCPFVAGCDARIPIRYEDPKIFDDTPEEQKMYAARSKEIASEMKYVFSQIK
jgi:arsenate reductase